MKANIMRNVALPRALVVISTVAAVAWTAGMAAALSRDDRASSPVAAEAPALVEAPECWAPAPAAELPSPDDAMVQTVTVTIMPTALLRLDAAGRVVAAETNTGCAPRSTDQLFVVRDDGSLVPASGVDLTTIDWTGDCTTFGFLPQQPQG